MPPEIRWIRWSKFWCAVILIDGLWCDPITKLPIPEFIMAQAKFVTGRWSTEELSDAP